MMFMWLTFLDLGQWLQETMNSNPVNDPYFTRGASYVPPPLLSFNEIPKYRGIDKLNTTLHLIINKFIENQQKTGLNFDCITNLGRFLTNNFTTKQQINTNRMTKSRTRPSS